jgi:threonine/homoserine/homoserine lactone efflux protein
MEFVAIILQGLITGGLLTLSFGAGFFALIQTSINRGPRKALFIAYGALISDFFFIAFAVFATSFVSTEIMRHARAIRIAGLLVFLFIGVRTILKSAKMITSSENEESGITYYLVKGIIINTMNPMVILTWIGIAMYLESAMEYEILEMVIYFMAVLLATFVTQLGICYAAHRIRLILSEKLLHRVNVVIGVIFIAMGVFIFMSAGNPQKGVEGAKRYLQHEH